MAACLFASGCAFGGNGFLGGAATHHEPLHRVTMHPGSTRLFSPGRLAAPLTVACPGAAPRTGVKQVIRSFQPGFGGIFGDSQLGNSLRVDVSRDGAVSITCS
jgi:hypothetical protein